ncbi:MAG TPA: DNA-3-methyladenine glycosylase 2 family protein [Gemmatimonadales bacterium]|nr:DNA-3-methyladenine glycosylase 2 family protein [Gemmatimonadales bacterium]
MPTPRPDGLCFDPDAARVHLEAADPALAAVIRRAGRITLRPEPTQSLFAALLRSIVYQQLSGKAAATIHRRVLALFAPKRHPSAADLLAVSDDQLRAAGLSRNKTAAVRDLARRTLDGTVPRLAHVHRLDDEAVIERLTAVRGVGRWTAEMILMFRLGRADVLPLGDLGVRKGFQRTYGMRRLPSPVTIERRAERWRPYRSAASWYLWRAAEF